MHSCFYEGTICHRRFAPIAHAFKYRLFLVYVDLAELSAIFGGCGLWSTRWPAAARFCRADHLGSADVPLDEAVRDLVQSRLGRRPRGPIRLLTNFRYFGFQMNPVSLFYCFDPDPDRPGAAARLSAVVAEVNNTPWNERHFYVLDVREGDQPRGSLPFAAHHRKQFHVSPFFPMKLEYHWQISAPGERLSVSIESTAGDVKQFDANLELQRRPINSGSRLQILARNPAMTLRIFSRIYWQAFRLWRKGAPFYPHPDSAEIASLKSSSVGAREPADLVIKTSK
jgi:uncharacterized protein